MPVQRRLSPGGVFRFINKAGKIRGDGRLEGGIGRPVAKRQELFPRLPFPANVRVADHTIGAVGDGKLT
jgi:hypothetical protein